MRVSALAQLQSYPGTKAAAPPTAYTIRYGDGLHMAPGVISHFQWLWPRTFTEGDPGSNTAVPGMSYGKGGRGGNCAEMRSSHTLTACRRCEGRGKAEEGRSITSHSSLLAVPRATAFCPAQQRPGTCRDGGFTPRLSLHKTHSCSSFWFNTAITSL